MNFLETQHQDLEEQSNEGDANHFQASSRCFPRRAFLFHTLQYLTHVKDGINSLPSETEGITLDHLKAIRAEDRSAHLFREMGTAYKEVVGQKGEGEDFDEDDIMRMTLKTFKWELIEAMTYFFFSAVFRIGFSILIYQLLQAVQDRNLSSAYIFCSFLIVCWYLFQLGNQSGCLLIYILSSHMKGAFSMLLYSKVSKLTACVLNSSEIGKITNLLSNDLSAIEMRLMILFEALAFVMMSFGFVTLLIIRLGWVALIGIVIMVLQLPISNKIAQKNGDMIVEANEYKDSRVQMTSEMIEGIKYTKLYGWELAFQKIIQNIREKEISKLSGLAFGRAAERALANATAFLSCLMMFIMAEEIYHNLTFVQIFSALQMFASIKKGLADINIGVSLYYEIKVIFNRFANIFNIENKSMIQVNEESKDINLDNSSNIILASKEIFVEDSSNRFSADPEKDNLFQLRRGRVQFSEFNGYWKKDFDEPALKNISYNFFPGRIYGITGKVGSGKSGLIGAILKEIPYFSGKLEIEGKIAYVEQEPVVFSDTIKKNILFGRAYDEAQYERAVSLSCLKADLAILPEGENTIVGEKGITLSGGQKARLTLARALYGEADIYLLDDPISAVDSKVAKKLFHKCIKALGKEKTVVLVTHQISYIEECDEVIIMKNGAISSSGKPGELKKELSELVQLKEEGQEEEEQKEQGDKELELEGSIRENQANNVDLESIISLQVENIEQKNPEERMKSKFDEKDAKVTVSTYVDFFWSTFSNYFIIPISLFLFLVSEGIITMFYRFLADFNNVKLGTSSTFGGNFGLYWGILGMLVLLLFIVMLLKYYLINIALLNASEANHDVMLKMIVRCPGNFFDKTPSGQLTNKFSNDLGVIDNTMIFGLIDAIEGPAMILIAIVNLAQINPILIIAVVIILIIAVWFFFYSRPVIHACKQLDLQKKTPVFHFFGETISGVVQLRIYDQRKQKIQQFSQKINRTTQALTGFNIVSRGFAFYETIIGILLMIAGLYLGISQISTENASLYGVTAVYLITISQLLEWFLRQIILVESLMISAKRILQFRQFNSEKDLRTDYDKTVGLKEEVQAAEKGQDFHEEWPEVPSLEMKSFSGRYDDHLPLVLRDLNIQIKPKEKVGIVGRTGAGKSSIIQAVFRIFEPQLESVYKIGGHDALSMGLHSLRQHISVIPQVPFLFKGTVRENIDPFSTASDERIWQVLDESSLKDHVSSFEDKLDTKVANIAEMFSVGQRQLLCLARALLRKNKFLVLDEATSNVDMQTDSFIQKVIREKFVNTTVITIAHRLNTIADYDKVIVMKRGKIVEQGTPWELIKKKGQFQDMVKNTGKNAEIIVEKARQSYKGSHLKDRKEE